MSLLFDAFKFLKGDSVGKVTEEVAKKRLEICNDCENQKIEFNKKTILTGRCKICYCVVSEKVKYKDEKCPIDRW